MTSLVDMNLAIICIRAKPSCFIHDAVFKQSVGIGQRGIACHSAPHRYGVDFAYQPDIEVTFGVPTNGILQVEIIAFHNHISQIADHPIDTVGWHAGRVLLGQTKSDMRIGAISRSVRTGICKGII